MHIIFLFLITFLPVSASTYLPSMQFFRRHAGTFSVFTLFFLSYRPEALSVSKRLNTLLSLRWIIKTLLLCSKFAQFYNDAHCLHAECYFPSCFQKTVLFLFLFNSSRAGVYYCFAEQKREEKNVFQILVREEPFL